MTRVAIATGSTRPGRNNEAVARWALDRASRRKEVVFDLVDIASYNLPLLDEPVPPGLGKYSHAQTDLDKLLGTKYQVSIGIRHRIERFLLSFAIAENLQNVNNTPDIGSQLGFACIPNRVAVGR